VIDFPADSRSCKLKGFQGCGVQCITIPASVELIHETAFADYFCLEIVRCTPDRGLRQIDGFRGCSIVEVRILESVELIGRSGFLGCRSLRCVKFVRPSSEIVIEGFFGISCDATIRIPVGARVAKTAFRGCTALFLDDSESDLSRGRWGGGRLGRIVPAAHSSFGSESCMSADISSSSPHLPRIVDVSKFQNSLAFRLRLREEPIQAKSHTRFLICFSSMSQTVSLDSVVAMLAISPNFTCAITQQKGHSAYYFVVNCGICGDHSSVSVICPVTGPDLTVSTRNHC
jgi:hypothetical protein